MLAKTIKLCHASAGKSIERNYLFWRDNLGKAFTFCLVDTLVKNSFNPSLVVFEDAAFQQHYTSIIQGEVNVLDRGYHSRHPDVLPIYMDMLDYVEDFVTYHFQKAMLNIYSITIDHEYKLVITQKSFGARYVI